MTPCTADISIFADNPITHLTKAAIVRVQINSILKLGANNRFFYTVLLVAAIWHLWSLKLSPLPWFDESFYASIAHSLLNGNGFKLTIWSWMSSKEILLYGPVYFVLVGLPLRLMEFDAFSFRITNLIFGATLLWMIYRLCKTLNVSVVVRRTVVLVALFDVLLIQNSHSGRMEMVALTFAMAAFGFYFKTDRDNRLSYIPHLAIAGALAFLTTPRVAVIIIPLFAFAFVELIHRKQWYDVLRIVLIPSALILAWVLAAYGSIDGFIDYYFSSGSREAEVAQAAQKTVEVRSSYTKFFGGNFYVPFYQWPLLLAGLASAALLLWKKAHVKLVWLFLFAIACYYLVVRDTGGYSVLILSFWYVLIALALHHLFSSNSTKPILRWVGVGFLALVLAVNVGIFSLKALTVVAQYNARNPKPLKEWVANHVEPGSRVAGDDRYYYACMGNGADFWYLDRPKSDNYRAERMALSGEVDYLFFSSQTEPKVIDAYRVYFNFDEEWEYTPEPDNGWMRWFTRLVPNAVQSSYQGRLVKVSEK